MLAPLYWQPARRCVGPFSVKLLVVAHFTAPGRNCLKLSDPKDSNLFKFIARHWFDAIVLKRLYLLYVSATHPPKQTDYLQA